MVRETRYLWVANLPSNIKEDRLKDYFRRFGRVQNVKLQKEGDVIAATVAFMDIKSASKARYSDHSLDDKTLRLDYWEPGGPPPFSMRLNSEGSRSPSGSPSPGRSRSRSSGHGSPRTRRSRSSSVSSRGSKSPRVQRAKLKNSVGLGPPGGSSSEPPSLAMCVRNLPLRSSDTSLKDGLFHEYKKHGKVICVKVSGQGPERFAVVTFKKVEDLEKALEVSKDKMFFGSKIEVSRHEGSLDVEDNEFRPLEAELDEYHPKATRTLFVGNLEREISLAELRNTFIKFGDIIDVDVKKQGVNTVYAFIQYPDISSVVKAMREMDGEHLGANRIKLGFGKSMPSPVMWIDGIGDNVPEKYLTRQMARFGPILYTVLDRRKGHAMIFFEQTKSAVAAVQEMRGRSLGGRRLQVDFASKECQLYFLDSLEPSCIDRPWEREIRELIGRPPPSRWNSSAGHPADRRSRGAARGRTSTRSVDEFSQCSSGSREDLRDALDDPPSPFNSPRRYKVELQKTRRNRSSESQGSDTEARRRRPRSDSVESVRLSSRSRKTSDSRGPEKIQLSHLTEAEPTVSSDSDSECPIKKTKLSSSDSGVSDISVSDRLGLNQAEPVKDCDKKLGPQPKTIPLECRRRREDDGSRPGTPLCDELDSEDFVPDPRPVRGRTCPRPMCLPVPKWFDLLPSFRYESPRAGKSPRSLTPKRDSSLPRSPVPADEDCDSDGSVTPLVDKTLEEKLRQLDLMYEKWCTRTSGEYMPLSADMIGKFCEKPRVIDLEELKSKPSDTVQCFLMKKGVFDADFERLEKFGEKYEPKPIQGNEYLTRLQQLACSHLFRAQLPVETAQPAVTEPPTSEEKSRDMHPNEETTSEPEPPLAVKPCSPEAVGTEVEVEEMEVEKCDAVSVPELASEGNSEPLVVTPTPSEDVNLVPDTSKEVIGPTSEVETKSTPELDNQSTSVVDIQSTSVEVEMDSSPVEVDTRPTFPEVDIKEVVVDTPPSSIEQLDTKLPVSEVEEKTVEEVKSEPEQPSEAVSVEQEAAVVTAEPEPLPEETKKEAAFIPAPPLKQHSKDKKSSSQKIDRASVGSFESTLLGLEGPVLKVDQKSKTETSKSRDEKRRDEKSSRSSKSSSSRDKSDRSDSKSEAVKRKSATDRDDSKRPKLDDKGKESSRSGKSRHESSHSKDKHSSRTKDQSKHQDKSKSDSDKVRSEKSDPAEKSRSEKSDSTDKARSEKLDSTDKARSEKSDSADKSKSDKSDLTDKLKSEKSDSTDKSKSDSADKSRSEKSETTDKRSEKSDEKSRNEKSESKSEKSRSSSEKVRHDSDKSKSKDKSKEERSKDRNKLSSRKSDAGLRDSTPKPEKARSPTPSVRIEESTEQSVDTSSFFPDLSSSEDEAPKSAVPKAESAPVLTPASSKSKSDSKSTKNRSKKKRSMALVIDDSDGETEQPKPVTKSSPPPTAESKKKEQLTKSPKEPEKQETVKTKSVESKPKNVDQTKPKKKLDTREVFSSDDSDDEKTKKGDEVKHHSPKKETKKPEKAEPQKKEKKLDVRRVFSSDDSDEDSQPVTPRAPEPPSERPRLFSSSEDEGAPPQNEPSKKGAEVKKSLEKSKGDQPPKKTESETKSKSSKHEADDVESKAKSDVVKSSYQKSPVSSRYDKIYSSDDEPVKKEVQVRSPVKQTPFFGNSVRSSSEDERPQIETPRKKKVTKKKSSLDFQDISGDEEVAEKSKKLKNKKKKSKNQPKEKAIYTSDDEQVEEKPKSKGPSNKAELKPRLVSSDEEIELKPSKPQKPDVLSDDEPTFKSSKKNEHLNEEQPKVKPSKTKLKVKEEISSEDEIKVKPSKGPKAKPELKQISTEEKKWTPPKPAKSFFSSEDEFCKREEPMPERERNPSSKSGKSKSKKPKPSPTLTSDDESAREGKKVKPRTKSPRARSLSDSESDSDSDIPEKNIFIVEEEPIYISMYDKVKARSCKRVSNPAPPPTPTTEKKKSRKSSGYDSERAKSALSSCDEVERKQKKQEKKRQEKKILDSDDEFIASLAKAKPKVDEPIRKPKEKKKEAKEIQTDVKRTTSSEFSDDSESLAKFLHKKSKKKTEIEPADVEVRKFQIPDLSPPTSPVRENDTHSQLSEDNEAEVRPKPKPRARPVLPIPAKAEPDEDPFDALLKTAKPLTYSPISSPRIFKHEERENIPEKKKKKKERRESFEILSESNKNNGFVLAEQMKLKSPSCEREVVEKLLSPKSIKSEMLDLDECPPTPTMPELELASDEARSDKSKGHKKKKKEKKNKEERIMVKKHKKSRSKSPAASREPLEVKEPVVTKEEVPSPPRFASPEPPRCTSSPTLHDSSFEEVRPTSSLSQSSFGKGPRPVVISQKTEDAVAGLLEETFDFGGFSMKSDDELALVSMRAEEDRSLLYEAQKALQSLAEENQPSPLLEQALAGLAEDDTFETKEALASDQLQEEEDEKEPRVPFPNWQQVDQLDEKSSSRFSLFSPPPEEPRLQSPKWASTFTAAAPPPATPTKEKGDEEKKETSWDLSSIMRRAMNAPSDSQRKPVITTPTREEPTMKHPAFDTIPTRPARQRRGRKSIQEDGEEPAEPVGRGRGGRRKQNRMSEAEVGIGSAESSKEHPGQLPRPSVQPEVPSEPEPKNSVDSVLDAVARGREQSPQTPTPVSRIQSPGTTRAGSVFLTPVDQPPPLTTLPSPIQGPPRLQSPQANHPQFPVSQPNTIAASPRLQSPPPVSMSNLQHLHTAGITPITPVQQLVTPITPACTPSVVSEAGQPVKEEKKEERLDQVPPLTTPTRPPGVIRTGSKLEQIANRLRPADPAPAHFIPVAKVELPPGFQQSVEQQQRLEQMTVKPERPSPGAQPSAPPQQRAGQPIITHGSHPQHTSPVKGPAPYSGPQGPIPSLPRDIMRSPESVRIHSPFSNNRVMQGAADKMPFEAHTQNQANQPQNQARGNNQAPHMSQNFMQHHPNAHIQGHGQMPGGNQQGPHQGMHVVQQVNLPRQATPQQHQALPQQNQQHPGQMRHPAPQFNSANSQQAHANQPAHAGAPQAAQLPKQAHEQQFQQVQRPPVHHPAHMNPGHIPVPVQQMSMQPRQITPNQQQVRPPAQKAEHFLHRDQAGQNVRMPVGAHQQAPDCLKPFIRLPLPAHQGAGIAAQSPAHQPRSVTPAHQASKQTPYLSGEAPVGISPPLAHGGSAPMTTPLQKQLQQIREQAPGSPLTFRNPQHEVREESVTPHVTAPGIGTPFDSAPMAEVVRQNAVGRPGTDIAPSAYVMYQHFLRAQQQPGGRTGFISNDERTTDSPIMYRSPPPAPHAPAAVARTPTVQTPPQASQVPPQADSLLTLLNQRYPVMWQGLLALKNDQAAVQMHFISGNASVARGSLPRQPDGSTLPLRISQRMRLEQTQLEGVARKMQMEAEHCILLALPCGRDHMDVLQQSNNLKNGFITYLQCKQAAGIVNIAGPGSQQAAFVVHVFPSCEFGNENLARIAPDLLHRISELAHLLVIIATV